MALWIVFPVVAFSLFGAYGAGVSWNITPLFSRSARVSAAQENLASIDLHIAWQEWRARAQGAVTELEVTNAARSHAAIARFPPVEIGFQAARDVDEVGSAGVTLGLELPFFDRNQGTVARERALRTRVEAEYHARLLEARADVVRTMDELALVRDQVVAAREASEASMRPAEQARSAAVSDALSPLLAADILERAYNSRMRALQIEQLAAELQVALALASGTCAGSRSRR